MGVGRLGGSAWETLAQKTMTVDKPTRNDLVTMGGRALRKEVKNSAEINQEAIFDARLLVRNQLSRSPGCVLTSTKRLDCRIDGLRRLSKLIRITLPSSVPPYVIAMRFPISAAVHAAVCLTSIVGTVPLQAQTDPAQSASIRPLMAYVGTFSSPLGDVPPTQVDLPPGNGRGIHLFEVDRDSGALSPAGTFDLGTSPDCLVINAAGDRLYSSNETDRLGEARQGSISSFAIDPDDGQLTLLNTIASEGDGPTYVSIHPSGRFLFVANYFSGSIAVLPILADGRLGPATDVQQDAGDIGPTKATHAPPGSFAISGHDGPHAHMIRADPSGRFVLHVNLGLDRIYVWKFDESSGKLTANDPPGVALPPGDGPRHFDFHPNGRWFYSIQEEGSTIALFDYDATAGRLRPRQTVSSLPANFAGSNFCSEILVSDDGRFVYAGNRLHDSVGIFAIGSEGELRQVGNEWTRGNYPRSFNFDPSGQFLYVCNQRADNVTVFRVDRQSGSLKFTGHYTPVGNPSSIVFLELAEENQE